VDLEWSNSFKQNERNVSDTGLFPKLANLKKPPVLVPLFHVEELGKKWEIFS